MAGITPTRALDATHLRERNVPQQAKNDQEARQAVLQLNAEEEKGEKIERDKKTYGRTPDGIGEFAQGINIFPI